MPYRGRFLINSLRQIGIDGIDQASVTRGLVEGRLAAKQLIDVMHEIVPGFENARLRNFASSLGTRESRKIIGEYSLTESDVMHEGRFDDSIGVCPEFLDGYGVVILPTTGRYFHVPYGITIPKKIDNLLVAGRSVAGDKMSHTATRQMVCCAVTGQGTGVAAATSIKEDVSCRDVTISHVQKALEKQGVRIK
jgi:hypothetical protein